MKQMSLAFESIRMPQAGVNNRALQVSPHTPFFLTKKWGENYELKKVEQQALPSHRQNVNNQETRVNQQETTVTYPFPPLPVLTPVSRACRANGPGPSTVAPLSSGPHELVYICTCCGLTLNACASPASLLAVVLEMSSLVYCFGNACLL